MKTRPSKRPASDAPADDSLQRLVGAVAHEVRNPLVAIRTLAQLLPERWQDAEFRERFAEIVEGDVERIEDVVHRLSDLAALDALDRQAVDVVTLLESLIEERRDEIEARRLLVLKELDYTEPFALADPERLRDAFEGILAKTLELIPDRGDLFLASKHHASGLRGGPPCACWSASAIRAAPGPRCDRLASPGRRPRWTSSLPRP